MHVETTYTLVDHQKLLDVAERLKDELIEMDEDGAIDIECWPVAEEFVSIVQLLGSEIDNGLRRISQA